MKSDTTLNQLIESMVESGIPAPVLSDGAIVDGAGRRRPTVEDIAAEAYNRGLFDTSITWDEAVATISEAMSVMDTSRSDGDARRFVANASGVLQVTQLKTAAGLMLNQSESDTKDED